MVQNSHAVDTIVAQATPAGKGGVGIVRVSGPRVLEIATQILGKLPKEKLALASNFVSKTGEIIDSGIALFFKGPRSFTGEDVIEFQGHGSPVLLDSLVREIVQMGARLARPGEFTERAFLNDKIDLIQAESICDIISATSHHAAKCALRSLQGEFSKQIEELVSELIKLRMYVEAAIDFPEEEIDFLAENHQKLNLNALLQNVEKLCAKAEQGVVLNNGLRVVIAGPPNAGKSTLLNQLSGTDAAIVTDIPGTTRDVLRENVVIEGILCQLVDTAGFRETDDLIEATGILRARTEIKAADHLVWVVDVTEINLVTEEDIEATLSKWRAEFPKDTPVTIVCNKIDKIGRNPEMKKKGPVSFLFVSAKTTAGLDLLKQHLRGSAVTVSGEETNFVARRRHLQALEEAKAHLLAGKAELDRKTYELFAENLRQAQLALDTITGKFTTDDLLGKIFSEFCIGK